MNPQDELRKKLDSLNKAFLCAYIECPAEVVDDLQQRFQEYLAALLDQHAVAEPQKPICPTCMSRDDVTPFTAEDNTQMFGCARCMMRFRSVGWQHAADEKLQALSVSAQEDELRQCLQIIMTNAGNIKDDREGPILEECAAIEEAVKRASKIKWAHAAEQPKLTGAQLKELAYTKCGLQPAWMESRWQTLAEAISNLLTSPVAPPPQQKEKTP